MATRRQRERAENLDRSLAALALVLTLVSDPRTAGIIRRSGEIFAGALRAARLEDVSGAPVLGPMTGYQLYLANHFPPPRSDRFGWQLLEGEPARSVMDPGGGWR